jgi:hypothetical protein
VKNPVKRDFYEGELCVGSIRIPEGGGGWFVVKNSAAFILKKIFSP